MVSESVRNTRNKKKTSLRTDYFCLEIQKKRNIYFTKTNSSLNSTQALIHLNLETQIRSLKSLKAHRRHQNHHEVMLSRL